MNMAASGVSVEDLDPKEFDHFVEKFIADKNVDALEDLKDQLQEVIDRISTQIDMAGSKAAAEGVYADPEWYGRAKHALKIKRRKSQYLARELKKVRKELAQTDRPFGSFFMDAAKELLDQETLDDIFEKAKELRGY